jgi:hypothetical protein
MPDTPVRRLEDELAIRRVLHAYARGVDRRDWALFRSCFTDPVEVDLSSWNGTPAACMAVDEWVAGVRAGLSGFDATQHLTANHLVDVDGDTARCTSDVQASHVLDGRRAVIGGWYDTRLTRVEDAWRIASSTLHVTWREGPEALFAEAARRHRTPTGDR